MTTNQPVINNQSFKIDQKENIDTKTDEHPMPFLGETKFVLL